MAKEKKAVKVVKKGKYTLEVTVNDVSYKGSGDSMIDALAMFVASPKFPFNVKTRVLMSFSDGKRVGIQNYPALMARRVFNAISHKMAGVEILADKLEKRMY